MLPAGPFACKTSTKRWATKAAPAAALVGVTLVVGWFLSCSGSSSDSSSKSSSPASTTIDAFLRPTASSAATIEPLGNLSGVVYQSLEQRAWRMAQLFAGRAPTEVEYERLRSEGPKALTALSAEWVQAPAFGDRLRTIFNDVLHVSAANPSSGIALNRLLSARDFPKREWHLEPDLPQVDQVSGRSNRLCNEYGFIEGTLRRIAAQASSSDSVVRLFQGEVIFVNQCSARALGIEDALKWPEKGDSEFFLPFDVAAFRKESPDHSISRLRFSGLLTDFAFLHRYPYTVGNAHRSRAQVVLKHFLGVDVASLPVPPNGDNELSARPTLDDERCVSCHKILDPVANLFHNFSSRETARRPRAPLTELWPLGLLGQSYRAPMQNETVDAAPPPLGDEPLVWLGEKLASLPQFYESMVTLVWRGLTGQEFTPGAAKRAEMAARWRNEGASLRRLAVLLAELPDFHARDALGAAAQDLAKRGFAPQQFVAVNELQDRLLHALGLSGSGALATAFRQDMQGLTVPLGGIDHIQVTTRLKDPSPVWAASMQWIAARWACVFADQTSAAATIDLGDVSQGNANTARMSEILLGAYRNSFAPSVSKLFAMATGRPPSQQEVDVLAELFRSSLSETLGQWQQSPDALLARCQAPGSADPATLSLGQQLVRPGLTAAALFVLLHDEVALR